MNAKRKTLWMLGITTFLLTSGILGFIRWDRGAFPGFKPTIEEVTIETINRNHRGVLIHGMARHDLRITEKLGDDTWHIYPLLAKEKMNSKEIHVMVLTRKEPDSVATIEERTVEGLAQPPGRYVPASIKKSWEDRDYSFSPKFVLIKEFYDGEFD